MLWISRKHNFDIRYCKYNGFQKNTSHFICTRLQGCKSPREQRMLHTSLSRPLIRKWERLEKLVNIYPALYVRKTLIIMFIRSLSPDRILSQMNQVHNNINILAGTLLGWNILLITWYRYWLPTISSTFCRRLKLQKYVIHKLNSVKSVYLNLFGWRGVCSLWYF
jgi:hypothetical protein